MDNLIGIDELVNWYCEYYGIELWKDIPGLEGIFQVSNTGQVKSLDRVVRFGKQTRHIKGHILKKYIKGTCLYPQVNLSLNNKQNWKTVHCLVAREFIPNPNGYPQVNHIDEDVTNANAANLEWCDSRYNNCYGNHSHKQAETLKRRYAEGVIKKKTKPVLQYTKEGVLVTKYNSTIEAGKAVNRKPSNISLVCKGINKTAAGYVWRYAT